MKCIRIMMLLIVVILIMILAYIIIDFINEACKAMDVHVTEAVYIQYVIAVIPGLLILAFILIVIVIIILMDFDMIMVLDSLMLDCSLEGI